MLLGAGRIAGVSGLFARAAASDAEPAGRMVSPTRFILGLPLGALLVRVAVGPVETHFPSIALLLLGGLLVGFGTRLGSGCTSGHGVCGMSRLSKRSLVATAVFMTARHRDGGGDQCGGARMVTRATLLGLFCGALFGAGLAISGMADPARVRGFLDLFGAFDPTLAFVMIGALVPMAIAWRIRRRLDKPLVEEAFDLPPTSPDRSRASSPARRCSAWAGARRPLSRPVDRRSRPRALERRALRGRDGGRHGSASICDAEGVTPPRRSLDREPSGSLRHALSVK